VASAQSIAYTRRLGLCLVISAPSGAGKSTLVERLRVEFPHFAYSISCTTRAPRGEEKDGKDYHFLTREEFFSRREAGYFAEWAEVHGNLYGTLRSELERCLATGSDVILELDVQGMRSLKGLYPGVGTIFLAPPSMAELERRLRNRGTNDDADIALRMRNAETEMAAQSEFDCIIVNDTIDRAAAEMVELLAARRAAGTAADADNR
jgi:guanylate kinase